MIGVLVAACAPAAAPAISQHVAEPKGTEAPALLVTRHVALGTNLETANRYTSELTLAGTRASLTEIAESAAGAFTLERADREAKWTIEKKQTRTGPLKHESARLTLDVEGKTDSMWLGCVHRPMDIAPKGAHLVPRLGHELDCDDPGTWSPATRVKVDVLVCGAEDAADDDDAMTHWFFAPAPGIESVEQTDDCFHGSGLRLAQ
jgi:hypothetical protein